MLLKKMFNSSKPTFKVAGPESEPEPVKKIPRAGQKRTGSATLILKYIYMCGSGSTELLNTDLVRIRIHKTDCNKKWLKKQQNIKKTRFHTLYSCERKKCATIFKIRKCN